MFEKGVHGEKGEVTAVHGETATVKIPANKGCTRCGLCARLSETEMVVEAYALKPVQVGDQVEIGFQPGVIVQSAFILYLIPLMGLVLGYYVGRILFHGLAVPGREELFPALTSFVFLCASFVPIVFYDRKKRGDRRFRVYIREQT